MTPEDFYSFKNFGKQNNKVIFFFTAFRTKYWLYYPAIKKLTDAGYYVVVCDADTRMVFDSELSDFLASVDFLVEQIKKQVESLKKCGVSHFSSFGTSMGTVLAMRVAVEIDDIEKVIVNLTYGSFADNVYSWNVLKKYRARLEKNGINKAKLELLLDPISPVSMAPKLKGKKLLLYLAKRDKVILFEQSIQFKEALDKAGVEYVYYQNNNLGHYIGGFLNILNAKVYLDFLNR